MNLYYCKFTNVLGPSTELNTDRTPMHVFETQVETRHDDRPKVSQHGNWPVFTYRGKRTFMMEGDILAHDTSDYMQVRMNILSAFMPAPEYGYRHTGTLDLGIDGINEIISIDCNPDGLPITPAGVDMPPDVGGYQINLIADNPVLFGAAPQTFITGTPVGGVGGRTYPMTYNYHYLAGGGTGDTIVTNLGSVSVYPVVKIDGPSSGQSITITVAGVNYTMAFDGVVLGVGEYMLIDFQNRTVTSNSGGSLYHMIAPGSIWWSIPPGTYTVTYRAGTALAPSHAEISISNGYMI